MKVIDIPDTIAVKSGEKSSELSFTEFLTTSLDNHAELGKGLAKIRQAIRIHKAIESVNGEKVIRFDVEDYTTVKAAVEAMTWIPTAARQLMPYYEALEGAQDVETPTKK